MNSVKLNGTKIDDIKIKDLNRTFFVEITLY